MNGTCEKSSTKVIHGRKRINMPIIVLEDKSAPIVEYSANQLIKYAEIIPDGIILNKVTRKADKIDYIMMLSNGDICGLKYTGHLKFPEFILKKICIDYSDSPVLTGHIRGAMFYPNSLSTIDAVISHYNEIITDCNSAEFTVICYLEL